MNFVQLLLLHRGLSVFSAQVDWLSSMCGGSSDVYQCMLFEIRAAYSNTVYALSGRDFSES